MGFFDRIFGSQRQKKPTFEHVKKGIDPATHWDLVGKLGEGAFGDVWKAKNRIHQTYSAAKIIELGSEDEIEEHYGEVEILMKCNHQNIVKCNDSIYWEGKLWILIEYCEGGALDSIIEKIDHGLNEEQTKVVTCRTVAALNYLHSVGIVHRDLKAGNILLMPNGEVKLADFGVSALNQSLEQMRDTFIGTPYWMAPEVIMCETSKSDPYSYAADVWSLGITVIELTQMEPPHNDFSPQRVLMKIARGDPPKLCNSAEYSFPMNKFIEICLQKNPRDRPTCAELCSNQWIDCVESNKPLRQLLAETRAEVLEEVIKQADQTQKRQQTPPKRETLDSQGEETANDSMTSGDELTTYEKGIQHKFNSVSSSSSDSVVVNGGGVSSVVSTAIEQESHVNDSTSGGDKENEQHEQQAPIVNEIKVNVIGDGVVELKRIDGSVSGTVFGNKSNQTEKPSAMDIARQIAENKDEPTVAAEHKKNRRASASVLPISGPPVKPKFEKSKTLDHPSNDEIIIESRPGGTWFGSRRIKEKEAKLTGAEQIADKLNKEAEKTALAALDQAMVGADDEKPSEPASIQRKGASRDSYKNATTPDLERKEVKQMDKINEVKKRALKTENESKELTKDEKAKRQKKTLKRTRKFVVDGEEVTVTSTVTQSDADVERQSEKRIMRRQELQELRKLQIEEQRKMAALQHKLGTQTEQLTMKCEREIYDMNRYYTTKIEQLERQQKAKIEKLETSQGREQRDMVSQLKKEQQRELDAFNQNMKQEQSELKKQVAAQFNDRKSRQTTLKNRNQEDKLNEAVTKFTEDQKKSVAETERGSLLQRQELIREREKKIWDTEEAHLQEKHQTARSQLKDQFLLQKMLLVIRHDKETEQVTRHNERLVKAQEERQRSDRSRLPKWQRNDAKTRESMYKESLRIQHPGIDTREESEKLKEFKNNEEKRQENERKRQQQKHERQIQELNERCDANLSELKQIQNEKRRLLVETETDKLKSLDESFKRKFDHWRDKLEPRKQELEEQFSKQMLEWEQFFSQQDLPHQPSPGSKRLSTFYRIS